jgi:mono/diheme cytochrome c family protein
MARSLLSTTLAAAMAASGLTSPASADDAQAERGRYLVVIAGCSDCHTPGALLGAPDKQRYLGGSDVDRRLDKGTDHHRDPHRQNAGGAKS